MHPISIDFPSFSFFQKTIQIMSIVPLNLTLSSSAERYWVTWSKPFFLVALGWQIGGGKGDTTEAFTGRSPTAPPTSRSLSFYCLPSSLWELSLPARVMGCRLQSGGPSEMGLQVSAERALRRSRNSIVWFHCQMMTMLKGALCWVLTNGFIVLSYFTGLSDYYLFLRFEHWVEARLN